MEGLVKLANEDLSAAERIGYGAAGVAALGVAKNPLLGQKTMYHGTNSANAESIKQHGLLRNHGGSGASRAIGNTEYQGLSQGNIHTTRLKPVANMYAQLMSGKTKADWGPKDLLSPGRGEVIKMNMDYEKYKQLAIDNAGSDDVSDIPKMLRPLAKQVAARGPVDITPAEIAGSAATFGERVRHRAHALPSYMKNHPVRFGSGVGLAGLGLAGIGTALKSSSSEEDKA